MIRQSSFCPGNFLEAGGGGAAVAAAEAASRPHRKWLLEHQVEADPQILSCRGSGRSQDCRGCCNLGPRLSYTLGRTLDLGTR